MEMATDRCSLGTSQIDFIMLCSLLVRARESGAYKFRRVVVAPTAAISDSLCNIPSLHLTVSHPGGPVSSLHAVDKTTPSLHFDTFSHLDLRLV